MDSTTGGDANDEFARWLAETARADQADRPAPQQPAASPAEQPRQPPAAPPTAAPPTAAPAPQAQPAAPEFFGADQLAAPPTRPYEPQLGGPPVARSSYQPPAAPAPGQATPPQQAAPVQPAAPSPDYVTPTVLPPAQPEPVAEPPAGQPSWAPGYAAPTAAPSFESAPPPTAAPYTPPVAEPAAPVFPAPSAHDVPTVAYQPQAPAPSFQPPAYEPPPTASSFPAVAQQPAPSMPAADPFGSLFTDSADDTAARLAASPPPSSDTPPPSFDTAPPSYDTPSLVYDTPPLVSPTAESVPSDEDPMKSLFGLETVEQPAIAVEPELPTYTPEPAYTAPAEPEPAFATPPAYEPAQPAAPAFRPEPAYAAEPALASVGAPPAAAPGAAAPGGSYSLSQPGSAPSDDDPTAGTQFFGGGAGDYDEPPNLDATTMAEKIGLGLAIVLPPIGLIASIVNAVQSSRERGWVHRLVRISLVVAVITTVVAGFAGAALYKVIDDGRKHDQIAAASKQFCATVAADPSMIAPPSFGFPSPGATIADTITSFQAYVDKWTALGKVSPSGIRTDVNRVADAAQTIVDDVTKSRLVDDETNQANMSAVAGSTKIVGWDQNYCS